MAEVVAMLLVVAVAAVAALLVADLHDLVNRSTR
jgi:hypothetical protein